MLAWALLALPPVLVLGMVGLNVSVWPRGRGDGRFRGRVSVLIPARDEEENIERCVRAALGGTVQPDELLVYDDGSTDATAALVRALAAQDPRVRLLEGVPLPDGWVGKPHACARLADAATGQVLVFVDADTELSGSALARVASLLNRYRAGLVTLGIRQRMGSFTERLIIPLLHLSYLAWLPLPLIWRTRDPRLLVANGQVLAVTRAAYRAAGGWDAVRGEVVDDMAFARGVKRAGERVVFGDGFPSARARMYRGARELWAGFSKNLYEGIGGRPAALLLVVALHLGVFVAPYAALAAGLLAAPIVLAPAAAGVAANVALRALLAVRFRQPWESVVLHPLAVLGLVAIALNSYRWSRSGSIRWRGRSYSARGAAERVAVSAGGEG